MDFFSFKFLLFLSCGALAYYLCPARFRVKTVLPILNLFFIFSFVHDPLELLPLAIFILLGFASIRTIKIFPQKNLFLTFLGLILATFLYLKKYAFISSLLLIHWSYTVLGMSYVLFRMLQVLIDVYQGAIKENVSFISFLNYSCNFFSFISGPIQRYQDYLDQETRASEKTPNKNEFLNRFSSLLKGYFDGYIRIFILSAVCLSMHDSYYHMMKDDAFNYGTWSMITRRYIFTAFSYTLYLYFNFSGYMSIVIGIGELFGFRLPENFNKPFESRSFLDLWSRWHMTLSEWFKVYIFNPLIKFFAYRWPNPKIVAYHGVSAYFITFLLMGLWHGTSFVFLIYGLFLGTGMAVNKLFDVQMKKSFKVAYKKIIDHPLSGLVGMAATFSYFSIGLTCLWLDYGSLILLIKKINIPGFLTVFIGGALLCIPLFLISHLVQRWWAKVSTNLYYVLLMESFKLFIVLATWAGIHGAPDFIYKGF